MLIQPFQLGIMRWSREKAHRLAQFRGWESIESEQCTNNTPFGFYYCTKDARNIVRNVIYLLFLSLSHDGDLLLAPI